MNEDLKKFFIWLCANRLSLNVAKTEFIIFKPPRKSLKKRITFRLNGKTLFESKKIKYLGLIVDDRLSWKFHINELSKKLGRAIGVIYRLKNMNCPKSVLFSIYCSLFQSQLSYGLMAWGSASKNLIEKIFLLQKKLCASSQMHCTQPTQNLFSKILKSLIFGISLNINLEISCLNSIMVIFQKFSTLYLLKLMIHMRTTPDLHVKENFL